MGYNCLADLRRFLASKILRLNSKFYEKLLFLHFTVDHRKLDFQNP